MKCPHCGEKINLKTAMREAGSKGGAKSRRVLSPEAAAAMQEKSAAARRAKKEALKEP